MPIGKPKYKYDFSLAYLSGDYPGRFTEDCQELKESCECNKEVLKTVLEELKELESTTYDKDRVKRIRKILITGLS